ncbi:hypothetical protein BZB76_0949 [Actinomadura pelletieri DSM 43383]|uniref:Lipoprotein n=2 Tax=Actinomadura TaxID=1988 RepID=A0A372GN37_9ACTN|nr:MULTISPECIES: hypothetical protein [Actinomadura]RFS86804.1 hypothetical protein D0T12_00490 [Actinomadura spongiicola]RKS79481.1 hypothetical protein BZB76_0949 [Actinomadura pelletieri DSM 43383]
MRMSATKLIGALAVGGLLLGSTGCGAVDALAGGKKSTACKNIESELRSFSTSSMSMTSSGGASATAQKFSDTAAKVRSEGQNAGGDVETAATAFAGDLDKTAEMLRNLSSGNTSSMGQPNVADIQRHGNDLADACGFNGFRLGG